MEETLPPETETGSGFSPTRIRQFDPSIDISGVALDTNGDLLVLDRAGRRLLTTSLY